MALAPGARLGPYEVVAPLGAGGMGEVYRATDTRLGRSVALKVLPPDVTADGAARERFEREARLIASLQHPHICVLHDVGHAGDAAYLVMELLGGETLDARLVPDGQSFIAVESADDVPDEIVVMLNGSRALRQA